MMHRSGHVLFLARQAHERASSQPTEADVSIALSAAALEGFLNEVARSARTFPFTTDAIEAFADLLEEAEEAKLQPLAKYRFAIFALSGRFPSKGDRIPQRLAVVMRLRNSLMHLKPDPVFFIDESQEGRDIPKPPSEVMHLISAKIITLPTTGGYTWRQVVSVPAVSAWAHNTVVEAMKSIASAVPDGPFQEVIKMRTDHLPLI